MIPDVWSGAGKARKAALALMASVSIVVMATAMPATAQRGIERFDSSGFTYCDAKLLAAAWRTDLQTAKLAIIDKVFQYRWSVAQIDREIAPGRRLARCEFVEDGGYTYNDAVALGGLWGVSPDAAKARVEQMLQRGDRSVDRLLAQAKRDLGFGQNQRQNPPPQQQQAGGACNARFSCDFGDSPTCWFRVFSHNSDRVISVPAGQAQTIYGLQRGDQFCTSNRGTPPPNCNSSPIRMNC